MSSIIRLLSTLSLSALAVAIEYNSVALDCSSTELQAYILMPGQEPKLEYIALANSEITQCTAKPDNPQDWPSKITDEFSSLNVTVTGGGSTLNVNNPDATFSMFTFDVQVGNTTGQQELTADKVDQPWSFVSYSDTLLEYKLDCGALVRTIGDQLTCTVTSEESDGSPRFVSGERAKPNVQVEGGATPQWDDWKIPDMPEKRVVGSVFNFSLTLTEAKPYFVTVLQKTKTINVVDVPDETTVIKCDQNFTNPGTVLIPQQDIVTCTITPKKNSEKIDVEPDEVAPSSTDLTIARVGDWEIPAGMFQFSLKATAGQKSGIYNITVGVVGTEMIYVLGEPSNSTSTCECDATDIFIASSVLCTSTARDSDGDLVFFDINRYSPASTSDRSGVAAGFPAGYVMDVTGRNKNGRPTIASQFVFRFTAEDRGFEERKMQDKFTSQSEASAECMDGENSVATLCQKADLQYVLDMRYIKQTTGWGWTEESATDVFKIDFEKNSIDNETSANLSSAFCCAGTSTLNGKEIKIVDGVATLSAKLQVLVADDVNTTVTAGDLNLECDTPIQLGSTSRCMFFAGTTEAKIAIAGDRLMVNGSPLAGEAGNIRNEFVFPITPDAGGGSKVTVVVSNPKDSSNVSTSFDITVEGGATTTEMTTTSQTSAPAATTTGGPVTDGPTEPATTGNATDPATPTEPATPTGNATDPATPTEPATTGNATDPATPTEPAPTGNATNPATTSGPAGNTTKGPNTSSALSTVSNYGAFALLLQCLLVWA